MCGTPLPESGGWHSASPEDFIHRSVEDLDKAACSEYGMVRPQ